MLLLLLPCRGPMYGFRTKTMEPSPPVHVTSYGMAWHGMNDHRGVQHRVLRGLFFFSFLSSSWLLLLVGSTGSLTMLDPISIFIPCIPKPGSCVSSIDGAAGVLDCCRRGPPNKLTGVI